MHGKGYALMPLKKFGDLIKLGKLGQNYKIETTN